MTRSGPPIKLKKSPLVYVIGQVRTSAILDVGSFVPKVQEKLRRAGYPKFARGKLQEIQFGPEGPSFTSTERFEFLDKAGTTGVVLAPEFLSLHTTAYDTFESFLERFESMVDIVNSVIDYQLIERIGLRYVDLVRVSEGEQVSDYIKPSFWGMNPTDVGASAAIWRYEFVGATEPGKLTFKFFNAEPKAQVPPDLRSNALKPASSLVADVPGFFLDFDHFSEESIDFGSTAVMARLRALHYNLDLAFRAAVTDLALERWGATPV